MIQITSPSVVFQPSRFVHYVDEYSLDNDTTILAMLTYASLVMVACCSVILYLRYQHISQNSTEELLEPTSEPAASTFVMGMTFAWALVLGVMVTVQAAVVVKLNETSPDPRLHSLSASAFTQALTLIPLSLSYFQSEPLRRPPVFACFAGCCTMLSFTSIVAGKAFGFEVTLTTQMLGSLAAALSIDYFQNSNISLYRLLCTGAVIFGATLLLTGRARTHESAVHDGDPDEPDIGLVEKLCLLLVVVSGAGYALQSRCTVELKTAFSSPFRAAFVCNLVTVLIWIPLLVLTGVPLQLRREDWPLWIFCAAQNIFHISSMAVIPKLLSYAAAFTAIVTGQLLSAAVIDLMNVGWKLPSTENTMLCVAGLSCSLLGAVGAALATQDPARANKASDEPDKSGAGA